MLYAIVRRPPWDRCVPAEGADIDYTATVPLHEREEYLRDIDVAEEVQVDRALLTNFD